MALRIEKILHAGATILLQDGSIWNIPMIEDRKKTELWVPREEVETIGGERLRCRVKNLLRDETVNAQRLK